MLKTIVKYYNPPSEDYILPGADETKLSKNSYCKEFVHFIDVFNEFTYFYPIEYQPSEGVMFNRIMKLQRVLLELPEEFRSNYHLSYNH